VARAGASAFDARSAGSAAETVVATGAPALDSWLPAGGLARAGLHEFTALRSTWRRSHSHSFWLVVATPHRLDPSCACALGLPYGFGLGQIGFDPDRLLLVEAPKARDALWAAEESLRAACAGAVLLDGVAPDLTAQRRLLLAAEQGDGPALPRTTQPALQVRAPRQRAGA